MKSLEKLDRATREKVEAIQRRIGSDAEFRRRLLVDKNATLRSEGLAEATIAGVSIREESEVAGYHMRVEIGDCCAPVPDTNIIHCWFCDEV